MDLWEELDTITDEELMHDPYEDLVETDDDYPEDYEYYEDWDHLEMGFDPYMGCYSDDC